MIAVITHIVPKDLRFTGQFKTKAEYEAWLAEQKKLRTEKENEVSKITFMDTLILTGGLPSKKEAFKAIQN